MLSYLSVKLNTRLVFILYLFYRVLHNILLKLLLTLLLLLPSNIIISKIINIMFIFIIVININIVITYYY